MAEVETRRRDERFGYILKSTLFGVTFSATATLLTSIWLRDPILYYAGIMTASSYLIMWIIYYFTFVKNTMSIFHCKIVFGLVGILLMFSLTYIAGGYTGPLIPGFFFFLVMVNIIFPKDSARLMALGIIAIYLFFVVVEEAGLYSSPMKDPVTIKYSRAIINILCFILIYWFGRIIAENAESSIKYYQLRSTRLRQDRLKLEKLVSERTKELEDSNKRLKDAQENLKRSYNDLKELDKRKDEFISIVSHELQTPMASMLGFSQLLKDPKIIRNKEKRVKYLDIIENETKRLSTFVKQILDISRIDMGTTRFEIVEFEVPQLIDEVVTALRVQARKKGLKIYTRELPELPKVKGDRGRVKQVLINLVNNSIKYTDQGFIEVYAEEGYDEVIFSVKDTGIGIPREYYDKIFERFFQIESHHSRKQFGIGLGLSLVKELTELMGGKVWLNSKVGKGTTFFFSIPIVFEPLQGDVSSAKKRKKIEKILSNNIEKAKKSKSRKKKTGKAAAAKPKTKSNPKPKTKSNPKPRPSAIKALKRPSKKGEARTKKP